jgi:hypothetical protein
MHKYARTHTNSHGISIQDQFVISICCCTLYEPLQLCQQFLASFCLFLTDDVAAHRSEND